MEMDKADDLLARFAIREVVERWAVARDAGHWDALLSTWHPGGRMHATWFEGDAEDFVSASRKGFDAGVTVHHSLGGSMVEVRGARAVAQTKATIAQRTIVDGVECDVVCTGRFFDLFSFEGLRWGIALRQPIYEKDRLDPVDPAETMDLDRELLGSFPVGCRHLLYAQHRAGMPIRPDQPQLRGDRVAHLYAQGRAWLDGAATEQRTA